MLNHSGPGRFFYLSWKLCTVFVSDCEKQDFTGPVHIETNFGLPKWLARAKFYFSLSRFGWMRLVNRAGRPLCTGSIQTISFMLHDCVCT